MHDNGEIRAAVFPGGRLMKKPRCGSSRTVCSLTFTKTKEKLYFSVHTQENHITASAVLVFVTSTVAKS